MVWNLFSAGPARAGMPRAGRGRASPAPGNDAFHSKLFTILCDLYYTAREYLSGQQRRTQDPFPKGFAGSTPASRTDLFSDVLFLKDFAGIGYSITKSGCQYPCHPLLFTEATENGAQDVPPRLSGFSVSPVSSRIVLTASGSTRYRCHARSGPRTQSS